VNVTSEFRQSKSAVRMRLYVAAKFGNHLGSRRDRLRAAAPARTVSGALGLFRRFKEFNLLLARPPAGTRRTAINTGRSYGVHKLPIGQRAALQNQLPSFHRLHRARSPFQRMPVFAAGDDPNLAVKVFLCASEKMKGMKRMDLYIKVEVELDEAEKPDKVAAEICRVIQKLYAVRSAELSSAVAQE